MNSMTRAAASAGRLLLALAVTALVYPSAGEAQTLPPPGTSAGEIQRQVEAMGLGSQLQQRILDSGLSADQIRQQLAARGYDPSVLDPYLDRGMGAPPPPGGDVYSALQALDIEFEPQVTGLDQFGPIRDSLRVEQLTLPDSSSFEREHDLRVYGLRTFARGTTQFDPMAMGTLPPGYVLGPGDELVLILTGDVEQAYRLPVTREGFVVIPQVGQVWVNGLTMSELRDRLYQALGRAYSGVRRGPEASTHFEVTLGRLRSNQLFVTGEVLRPGSYLTSPVASVLNALYLAGGPQPNGSFRQVRVMRDGRAAAEVDLYAYLARGDNVSDVILQPGDVIFVPVHGPQVAVKGEVGRPAIYELRPGEDLVDLLQFAGGLAAPAAVGRARITRILPPWERGEGGLDRTVVEVDLAAVIRGDVPAPELRDGDELRIFRVRSELRGIVTVSGPVWKNCEVPGPARADTAALDRPLASDSLPTESERTARRNAGAAAEHLCTFRLEPGMRAWDAIEAAEGLKPDALLGRAQILRLEPTDSTLTVIPFSLELDEGGVPVSNPVLQEFDHVRVFSRTTFRDELPVRISGEVRDSMLTVTYREGLTLSDLILEAGGLTPEADLVVEVSRRPGTEARRAGQITVSHKIPVSPAYIVSERGIRNFRAENPELEVRLDDGVADTLAADRFLLRPHDRVFVRRLPNIQDRRLVQVEGEVLYPGTYTLRTKDERLSQLIERAGTLTRTAFTGGFRFYRDGSLVNVDLDRALSQPGSRHDILLLPGDSLVVPEYNPVVTVRGAVHSPATVMYREGASLDYYIASAGGYARHADRDRTYVQYANGQGAVPDPFLFFSSDPRPGPGSTVTVPLVPEQDRIRPMQFVRDVAQILGTIGAALVIFTRF